MNDIFDFLFVSGAVVIVIYALRYFFLFIYREYILWSDRQFEEALEYLAILFNKGESDESRALIKKIIKNARKVSKYNSLYLGVSACLSSYAKLLELKKDKPDLCEVKRIITDLIRIITVDINQDNISHIISDILELKKRLYFNIIYGSDTAQARNSEANKLSIEGINNTQFRLNESKATIINKIKIIKGYFNELCYPENLECLEGSYVLPVVALRNILVFIHRRLIHQHYLPIGLKPNLDKQLHELFDLLLYFRNEDLTYVNIHGFLFPDHAVPSPKEQEKMLNNEIECIFLSLDA